MNRLGSSWKCSLERALPYVLIFVLTLVVQGSFIIIGKTPVASGELLGADTYIRLVRVTQLFETGAWFDQTLPRSNAPFGEVLLWTRPFDVVLLAGAWLLQPFLGFKSALFWFGVWISPLLHAVTAMALAWGVAPFFDRSLRIITAMMVIGLPAVMLNSLPGRPDHHALILLAFVIACSLTVRLLLRPYSRGLALASGAAAGAGLWLSIEFLAALGAIYAATVMYWIAAGGRNAHKFFVFALGVVFMVATAVVVENVPSSWMAMKFERISAVHIFVTAIALVFWWLMKFAVKQGWAQDVKSRSVLAAVGAAVAMLVLLMVYPKFYGGPFVDQDPRFITLWAEKSIAEMQSLWPSDLHILASSLFYLGPALICVPFVVWVVVRERDTPLWPGWLFVALALAIYLPLGLKHIRFAPFTEILLLVILIEIFRRFQDWFQWKADRPIGQITRALVSAGLLIGFFASGVIVSVLQVAFETPKQAQAANVKPPASCRLRNLTPILNDPQGLGARIHTILGSLLLGPELLYRTRHRVIGIPHVNGDSIADTYAIFTATDDTSPRQIIDRRGIDLLLLCDSGAADASRDPAELHLRLIAGKLPSWIRRVELPPEVGGFRLFEVIR